MSDDEIARYYDSNTGFFLALGSGRASHGLHRGLWGPGVRNATEAAQYVNTLIAQRIQEIGQPESILDLGCGVGGTLFQLARTFPDSRLYGVTLSARQVAIAERLKRRAGLHDRCRFIHGNFESLRLDLKADVVLAVESLSHSARPGCFFETARQHLIPGGQLIVVDDFSTASPGSNSVEVERCLEVFRQGWRLSGLCSVARLRSVACDAGFRCMAEEDLTPLVRTGRFRDRLLAGLSPVLQSLGAMRSSFGANLIGGNALRRALRAGWVRYHMLCFGTPFETDTEEYS